MKIYDKKGFRVEPLDLACMGIQFIVELLHVPLLIMLSPLMLVGWIRLKVKG